METFESTKKNRQKKNTAQQGSKAQQQKVPLSTELPIIPWYLQEQKPEDFRIKGKPRSAIPLQHFLIRTNNIIKPTKQHAPEIYAGNKLDSSHPVRNVGKHREFPKSKVPSKLKHDILKQESARIGNDISINYCDNLVTDELNNATAALLKKIVAFQEKAFKRDENKARIKKRYVVGIHETKKYIITKKVKLLVIAADMKVGHIEELLYKNVLELKDLAKTHEIPYIFALKRSKIGNLTMKCRPIGCIAILSYQSAEDEFRGIFENLVQIDDNKRMDENECVYEELLDKLKEAIL